MIKAPTLALTLFLLFTAATEAFADTLVVTKTADTADGIFLAVCILRVAVY